MHLVNNMDNKINDKITTVEKGLGTLDKVVNFFSTHSTWSIVKSVLLCSFIGYFIYFSLNPQIIVERVEKAKSEKHSEDINNRFLHSKTIQNELKMLLTETSADRAILIEYHNSVQSLQGLPFAYGSLNFEEISKNVEYYLGDEFNNFNTSKYSICNYLMDNPLWYGDIAALEDIDRRLALKLGASKVQYLVLIEIMGKEQPIGILAVTYTGNTAVPHINSVISKMRQFEIRVAHLLSNTK